MKTLTALALVLLPSFHGARDPSPKSSQATLQESLIALEKQSWVAWQQRDGKFFERFLSDDHIEMGTGGAQNKAAVVAFAASPTCVVKSYTVEQFKFTAFGPSTAVLTYHADQTTTCNGRAVPSPAWATSVYIKRDGRWLNAVYQQTPTIR